MPTPDPIKKMRELVAHIEASVNRIEARLQKEVDDHIARWPDAPPFTPDDIKDSNGRYILLDARLTLLTAQIELASATRD